MIFSSYTPQERHVPSVENSAQYVLGIIPNAPEINMGERIDLAPSGYFIIPTDANGNESLGDYITEGLYECAGFNRAYRDMDYSVTMWKKISD